MSQLKWLSARRRADAVPYLVALVVTILWSSSYVLIKWGLEEIPPIYFATLRYGFGFVILAIVDVASVSLRKKPVNPAPPRPIGWRLVAAGVCGYTLAQGLQFVSLFFLPAITTTLLLNLNPIFVLIIGFALLDERVASVQLVGFTVALVGALVYFYNQVSWQGQWFGVAVTLASGVGWSAYIVLTRSLQKGRAVDSLRLTSTSMGIGVAGLAVLAVVLGQYAPISSAGVVIVVWLAVINTALAFFLWTWVLASVPAYQLTVLQSLMLIEIALFSVGLLGESLTPLMILGMALVLVGVLLVQVRVWPNRRPITLTKGL